MYDIKSPLTVNPNSNMFRAEHVPIRVPISRVRYEWMGKQHPDINLQSHAIHTMPIVDFFRFIIENRTEEKNSNLKSIKKNSTKQKTNNK